jgi:hypothetical protein
MNTISLFFLSVWCSGALIWGLIAVAVILLAIFWVQAYKAWQSGWTQQVKGGAPGGGQATGKEKLPLWKIHTFWFGVVVIIAFIAAVLIVASDYRGVTC